MVTWPLLSEKGSFGAAAMSFRLSGVIQAALLASALAGQLVEGQASGLECMQGWEQEAASLALLEAFFLKEVSLMVVEGLGSGVCTGFLGK